MLFEVKSGGKGLGLFIGSVACWFVGFALASPGATFTNFPTADTYSETYGSEGKNFGTAPVLRIDQWGGRQVFLRFPISQAPPGKRLLRTTLRLYITDIGNNEAGAFPELKTCVGLFDVVTPWTELGLTHRSPDGTQPWNQGPGIPGGAYGDVGPLPKPDIGVRLRQPAIPLDPQLLTNGAWLELDLTDFARDSIQAGAKELNLLLRSSTLGRNYAFASREAEPADRRPQMVFETAASLVDFTIETPLALHWKPGTPVAVRIRKLGQPGPERLEWSLVQMPAAGRLINSALETTPDGATFHPDMPGRYRVRLKVGTAAESTVEEADVFALSMQPHPRLYVTPESIAKMREQARSGARLTQAFLDWTGRGAAGAAQGRFHDMGPHEGCENTALAWLITSDRRFLSNSIAYAQRILQKPMREHFQDVHAATFLGAAWVHAMRCIMIGATTSSRRRIAGRLANG